jgi:hypothetical protein
MPFIASSGHVGVAVGDVSMEGRQGKREPENGDSILMIAKNQQTPRAPVSALLGPAIYASMGTRLLSEVQNEKRPFPDVPARLQSSVMRTNGTAIRRFSE